MHKPIMKLLLVLFCLSPLAAVKNFTYHINISNPHPVVKEAVILTMEFNQTRAGKVIRFSFALPKDQRYDTEFLEANENKDFKNRTRVIMKYAIFPKKAVDLKIPLRLTIQEASQEELKKFVTGSADELMYLQTTNEVCKLPAIELYVKPLPHKTKIVGDYRLGFAIDHNKTTADKQINVTYTLSGRGYRPDIPTLLPSVSGVTAFLAKEQFHDKLFHKVIFHYALISDQNFTIPQIKIPAYNPKKKSIYYLSAEAVPVVVLPAHNHTSKGTRLFPSVNRHTVIQWIDYFLLFLAGFLSYITLQRIIEHYNKRLPAEKKFIKKIKDTKNSRSLLQTLILSHETLFAKEIEELEKHIYHNRSLSISNLKKRIIYKFLNRYNIN